MSYKICFKGQKILSSKDLQLTLISMEDWLFIKVEGKDNIKYLQNQLTFDLFSLKKSQYNFAANCNAKGKVLSILILFHYHNSIAFIERRNIYKKHLTELKKYSIFSEINIKIDNNIVLLGLVGNKAQKIIKNFFGIIPDIYNTVVKNKNTTIIFFNLPVSRFLILTTIEIFNILKNKLINQIKFNNSQQWLALDIESGYPIIDINNVNKFIPQDINLHLLNGVSFNKGCYMGQEIIARNQYLNIKKYSLYWLSGISSINPLIGDSLEIKLNNKWFKNGTILAVVKLKNNIIWIQAVMKCNLSINNSIRISGDINSKFSICSLNYDIINN